MVLTWTSEYVSFNRNRRFRSIRLHFPLHIDSENCPIAIAGNHVRCSSGIRCDAEESFLRLLPPGIESHRSRRCWRYRSTTLPPAQTTVAAPVVSLGVSVTTSITSNSLAQSGATESASTSGAFANTGAIIGGVLGGLAIGILIAFLFFRWWSRRDQQNRVSIGPDGLPILPVTEATPRPVYFNAPPSYPSKRTGVPPGATVPTVTDRHSGPSTFVGVPSVMPASTAPEQGSRKARFMGNSQNNSATSLTLPPSRAVLRSQGAEGTGRGEAALPAYSQH